MDLDGKVAVDNLPETQRRGASEGKGWSTPEEQRLHEAFTGLEDLVDLSVRHARTRGAIRSRLILLGLLDAEGQVVLPKPPFRPSKASLTRAVIHAERSSAASQPITPATQLLQLFMQLPPERQEVALQVVRGLVALG
ncbi:hypothetical protein HN018_23420 (plasmid) [Lichenicola cladoniae]|uniref:Uncharacterized protein n=1 Tax=Lichenicola cladoniae TaxID=1484109 RepID=A0A6M8HY13_9PROT|nr:hypothetical protein [Lichenicola cladoniae]NPD66330.1 hypothetical protein [Acetobacteraceae bacterium]QKE93136.1 hypothetical protein HN018_23420 [Lichenicola cladoniae]